MLRDVFICGAARTPIGNLNGSLSSLSAPQLGALAVADALRRARVAPSEVEELLLGCVLTAGVGQAPARQACRAAGLPDSVVCTTVNKVCASGAKAILLAAQAIQSGADVVVAGGMESMSNCPYYIRARQGLRLGHSQALDGVIHDGLWDPYGNQHMGACAELCGREHSVSRAEQDAFAAESARRARAAVASGATSAEIVPVAVPAAKRGGAPVIVSSDETVAKGGDLSVLAKLAAVFQREGTVTAGNSSGISDGAAALVLCSADAVRRLGLTPLARLRGWGEAAQTPERFTTTPALAIPKALAAAGVQASQVAAYEINEAFSVVSIANIRLLGLDPAKTNRHGGAVAMGHPIGASGARIVVTLLNVLACCNGGLGVAAICNGGGGATALVVERLPQAKL